MWESKVDRGQSAGATSSDKNVLWTYVKPPHSILTDLHSLFSVHVEHTKVRLLASLRMHIL